MTPITRDPDDLDELDDIIMSYDDIMDFLEEESDQSYKEEEYKPLNFNDDNRRF